MQSFSFSPQTLLIIIPKIESASRHVLRVPASSKKQYEAFMLRKSSASAVMSIPKDRNMILPRPWKSAATLLIHCRRKVEASFSLVFDLQRLDKELLAFTKLHFFRKHSFLLLPKSTTHTKMSCVCLSVSEMTEQMTTCLAVSRS